MPFNQTIHALVILIAYQNALVPGKFEYEMKLTFFLGSSY